MSIRPFLQVTESTDSDQAACALPPGTPTEQVDAVAELFFPLSENDRTAVREATAYCARCPIAAACLEEALASGVEGIWGGTTTAQRRAMRLRPRYDQHEQEIAA